MRSRDQLAPRRAFTLAEMVVVVALIALLTVGIGRLFAGVSDAVGRGLAASELDATARAIENALRRDFERVDLMRSEETFLVIRAVELGGDPDRPIYLTQDDREADVLDGLAPYDAGSRAIHTRLDEMAFLAAGGGADRFRSQQDNGYFTTTAPKADAARVYYGHGLRPRLGPNRTLPDGSAADPLREFISDGWFGSPPGQDARGYLPGNNAITGRNEYAADWVLARQALLLYGSEATGRANPDVGVPSYGENREYAPYIRDLETFTRFWNDLLASEQGGVNPYEWPGPANPTSELGGLPRPDPRLIMHGRVDVCAQTLEGARRWLEGEAPVWRPDDSVGFGAYALDPIQSSAFGVDVPSNQPQLTPSTRYDLSENDLRGTSNEFSVQRWLWRRSADARTSPDIDDPPPPGLLSVGNNGNALDDLTYNHIGIRTALAGVLARPLVELAPAPESREEPTDLAGAAERLLYAQEHDAAMDTHAVIAARCSRFEIAWSDGSFWRRDVDLDNDGVFDVFSGDLVWFDPSRTDPRNEDNNEDAERMTYAELFARYGENEIQSPVLPYTDPVEERLNEVDGPLGVGGGPELNLNPEVGFGDSDYFDSTPTFANVSSSPLRRRLWIKTGDAVASDSNGSGPSGTNPPYYNPDFSGGAPSPDGWPDSAPSSPSDDINEYLAVWPFRVPASTGAWEEPFDKNVWIRVRFTLHDPQGRIDEGRDYEVILHMSPRHDNG